MSSALSAECPDVDQQFKNWFTDTLTELDPISSVTRAWQWGMHRENWGAQRSTLLLQAFVEIVVGHERIAKSQAIADKLIRNRR